MRAEELPTLAKVGGSQSSICSGCATASVTMSAMLMVPLRARTTALRFLQSTAATWTFLRCPRLQANPFCGIDPSHLPSAAVMGLSSISAATFWSCWAVQLYRLPHLQEHSSGKCIGTLATLLLLMVRRHSE